MLIDVFQHVPFEGLGLIRAWAGEKGVFFRTTEFFVDEHRIPDFKQIERLIVLGGPMAVYEEEQYPWIKQEKSLIRTLIHLGKPVLGICLGAQLVASALGARVYKGDKEIGWMPVETLQQGRFLKEVPSHYHVLHWHGDTFDLPSGAVRLTRSLVTPHQAFEYKNALALQFHLEMGREQVNRIVKHCKSDIDNSPNVQHPSSICKETQFFEMNRSILFQTLNNLFSDNLKSYDG